MAGWDNGQECPFYVRGKAADEADKRRCHPPGKTGVNAV